MRRNHQAWGTRRTGPTPGDARCLVARHARAGGVLQERMALADTLGPAYPVEVAVRLDGLARLGWGGVENLDVFGPQGVAVLSGQSHGVGDDALTLGGTDA